MQSSEEMPRLGKPGAGLPFYEWFLAKYLLLPKAYKVLDKEKALKNFKAESTKILNLARPLTPEQMSQKRLVPRQRGLEDSSRYWSVAMTMEHTITVGDLMRQAAVALSQGQSGLPTVGTADVKPDQPVDSSTIVSSFEAMVQRFIDEVGAANLDAYPNNTHPHPWFGPLNARKWAIFGGLHQGIHRRQIEEIIKRLDDAK